MNSSIAPNQWSICVASISPTSTWDCKRRVNRRRINGIQISRLLDIVHGARICFAERWVGRLRNTNEKSLEFKNTDNYSLQQLSHLRRKKRKSSVLDRTRVIVIRRRPYWCRNWRRPHTVTQFGWSRQSKPSLTHHSSRSSHQSAR